MAGLRRRFLMARIGASVWRERYLAQIHTHDLASNRHTEEL